MQCQNCNHKIKKGLAFLCPECGSEIKIAPNALSVAEVRFINRPSLGALLLGWIYFFAYQMYLLAVILFVISAVLLSFEVNAAKNGYLTATLFFALAIYFCLCYFSFIARRSIVLKMGIEYSMEEFIRKERIITIIGIAFSICILILAIFGILSSRLKG